MKNSRFTLLGAACLLLVLTGCTPTPAGDQPSADDVTAQDPRIKVLMDDLQSSTESEVGTRLATAGGGISQVPNAMSFSDISGKGPFTIYFTCEVPQGAVTLTLDSTTETAVNCDEGTKKITGVQQIALTGGLNIEVTGEAEAGVWALVAKGRA